MQYAKLGSTDIEVSKLCLGCMSFGKAGTMHGWTPFSVMENHYNLLYREDERELIPICRQMNVSLMPYSPPCRRTSCPHNLGVRHPQRQNGQRCKGQI